MDHTSKKNKKKESDQVTEINLKATTGAGKGSRSRTTQRRQP
jgi:hypothetical protein